MNICIITLLLLLAILLFTTRNKEAFNEDGDEFLPPGYLRYGLRGEKLTTHPVPDCYYDQFYCYNNTF